MPNTIQVTAAQLIIAIAGAAAIGALISSVVSELGKWRERKARQKELLLSTAVDVAYRERELVLKTLVAQGKSASVFPTIVTARWYHKQLQSLFESGELSDDMEKTFYDFINKSHSELDKDS